MKLLLSARNLTDLWLVTPDPIFRRLQRWLRISDEALHEWLCEFPGCRCN